MKKMMILGGLIGLLIGMLCGLLQGSSGASVLWRSSVAALLCGYLLRWWGKVWLKALHQSYFERLHPAAATEESQTPAKV